MTTPDPLGPEPVAFKPHPPSPRPGCTTCGGQPIAQWRRRPTDTELAALVTAEEARRAEALLLADPERPPVFPPLPTADDTTMAVHGCAEHAIHLGLAAHIHAADCAGCDCEPEPLPTPAPLPGHEQTITLPTGWTIPAPEETL